MCVNTHIHPYTHRPYMHINTNIPAYLQTYIIQAYVHTLNNAYMYILCKYTYIQTHKVIFSGIHTYGHDTVGEREMQRKKGGERERERVVYPLLIVIAPLDIIQPFLTLFQMFQTIRRFRDERRTVIHLLIDNFVVLCRLQEG